MFEDDDMRAIFLDPEDFGVEATITPAEGDPFTLIGIFDARPVGDRALAGAQVGSREGFQNTGNHPEFRCRTIDAATVTPGKATLTLPAHLGGKTFQVWDDRVDHTGFTTLILKGKL